MDKIKISVSGNIAVVAEKPKRITSGTTGLPVEFTFDSEWDELRKVAVFDACCVRKDMIIKDGATVVPIENLSTHGACLCIGVYGVNEDGSVAIPTIWANAGMIYPGAVPEGDLGSDIGTAKEQYDEAVLASERSENAANRSEAAASRAEAAADRAESAGGGSGGGSIIVALDEGNMATHTAAEIYDAMQNHQIVVFRKFPRAEPPELIPIRLSTPSKAVFSEPGYPTEFDRFDIEIDASGQVSYNTHFSSALVNQAVKKVETDIAPVSYLPQALTEEQKAQARENIGALELPCIKGNGAPTPATEGAVGDFYMDTNTCTVYKCTAVADGVYTWEHICVAEKQYELIETITLEEEVSAITRNVEPNRTGYQLKGCFIRANFPASTSKKGNIAVNYTIGNWQNGRGLTSYMINPFGNANSKKGYSRVWLDYDRWLTGFWTCTAGHGELAQYHENTSKQGLYSTADGYITQIALSYSAGLPVGTVIEIWGVR
jgi:hypothetical protein